MKAIGYARGNLYSCRYSNTYSVVISAPDLKTAREAFVIYLKNNHQLEPYSNSIKVKRLKFAEGRVLLWAQVDVTQT